MSYSLATIWHERSRYLPGILAVAMSAMLMATQVGLMLGLLSLTSVPVDHSSADIWVGHPSVMSVDIFRPIPDRWMSRVLMQEDVVEVESYLLDFRVLDNPEGGSSLALIVGTSIEPGAMGAVRELTPAMRIALTEPGTVVVPESDLGRLGLKGVGDEARVLGQRIRVVGTVPHIKSLAAPYLFCSETTARTLLASGAPPHQIAYVLARCRDPERAETVVRNLRAYPDMSVYTSAEFSDRSRLYWLTATKSGITVAWGAFLGLLVGAAVTSQTLYAATAASLREYAVLRALGIPSWRIVAAVMAQACWVGGAGVLLAIPAMFGLARAIEMAGSRVLLPPWLLATTAAVTMIMALVAGLAALRPLRRIEPADLLR